MSGLEVERASWRVVAGMVVVGVCLGAGSAGAQQPGVNRPERPNRALFGGGYSATDQSLVFNGQAGGGASFIVDQQDAGVSPSPVLEPRSFSSFASFDGTLAYTVGRERIGMSASAGSSTRYFPESGGIWAHGQTGEVSLRLQATRRTSLSARFGVAREPLSALALLPGLKDDGSLPLTSLDYGIGPDSLIYLRQDAMVSLSHSLTSRAMVDVGYHLNRAFVSERQIDRWSGGFLAGLGYNIGRGLALRLGYGLDESVYEASGNGDETRTIRQHRIDAGVDFNRALSISRRTTVAFRTGSMVLRDAGRTRYELVGSAALRREIGRSWFSSLTYNRDVEFVEVLTQPAFTDSLTGTVSGSIGRRVGITADAGVMRGEVGVAVTTNTYVVQRAGAGLTYGLTNALGLSVRYSFFNYSFAGDEGLPGGLPQSGLARQAVRVSLDFIAPLFSRMRRP